MQFSPRENSAAEPRSYTSTDWWNEKTNPRLPWNHTLKHLWVELRQSNVLAHRVIDLHHGITPPRAYQHGGRMCNDIYWYESLEFSAVCTHSPGCIISSMWQDATCVTLKFTWTARENFLPDLLLTFGIWTFLPHLSSSRSGKGAIPSLGSPQSLDGCYFSPTLVTDWFWGVVSEAVEELRRSPQRGIPTPERLERNGPLTTIILQVQIGMMIIFVHNNHVAAVEV